METMGIPKLTPEQMERLCEIAEKAAREHILSTVPIQRISDMDITIDTKGSRPITVNIELEITLSPLMKNYNAQKLADEAKGKAFQAIEKYLGKLACKSKK